MIRNPTLRIHEDEIAIDSFAGGGGASLGIEWALGRSPDIAINHDWQAIAMHTANHPNTRHYCEDVWNVNPVEVCRGRRVGLMWASPDCKHFSKAKGGKPVDKKIRGLADVVIEWARAVHPRVIVLENVEEFQDWGPLRADGMPNVLKKGMEFRRWLKELRECGYVVETRELRACDYGAPTSRKRLFVIARCDGGAIDWPEPTHGDEEARKSAPHLLPYRSAAECIDWDEECPSIFDRKKPLAFNTMKRIAKGTFRYVIDALEPFIIPVTHAGDSRVHSVRDPFRTITGAHRGEQALVSAFLRRDFGQSIGSDMFDPALAITAGGGGHLALTTAFMEQANTGMTGHEMLEPVSTIVQKGCTQRLVTSHMLKMYGTCADGQPIGKPFPTVRAEGTHLAEVRAFLIKHSKSDRQSSLVRVGGEDYVIVDIGMRMLTARELFRAQGFPNEYKIDLRVRGKLLSKTAQVRMCGNSVCPPMAAAIIRSNFPEQASMVNVANG